MCQGSDAGGVSCRFDSMEVGSDFEGEEFSIGSADGSEVVWGSGLAECSVEGESPTLDAWEIGGIFDIAIPTDKGLASMLPS